MRQKAPNELSPIKIFVTCIIFVLISFGVFWGMDLTNNNNHETNNTEKDTLNTSNYKCEVVE
jgi:hypothetical protein